MWGDRARLRHGLHAGNEHCEAINEGRVAGSQAPVPVWVSPETSFVGLVEVRNGVPMVSSLEVAERFKKRHADVLRAIQSLDCSEQFTERNFAFSTYTDRTGRSLPMCWMTREGFT